MENRQEDRYIRFDWAIDRFLRHDANFDVLEGFLTVFLKEKITIVEILEKLGNQQSADDRRHRIYIKARNSKDEIIIVEIQNTRELYYFECIVHGGPKAQAISLDRSYDNVNKVYSVNIINFDLGIGSDYLYYGQNHFTGAHTGDLLLVNVKEKNAIVSRVLSDIPPEYVLIRVNEFDKVAVTPLEEWMCYLKSGVIRPDTKASGLEEAREKLKYYSMNAQERHAYDEHITAMMIQNDVIDTAKLEGRIEGMKEGREEGIKEGFKKGLEKWREEGMKKGMEKANRENARKMKISGIPLETIHQITGLAPADIEKL